MGVITHGGSNLSSTPASDLAHPAPKRVLWKWSVAATALILVFLMWQCGSALAQGRKLADAAVRHFYQQLNAGDYEGIYRDADQGFGRGQDHEESIRLLEAVHWKLGLAGPETRLNIRVEKGGHLEQGTGKTQHSAAIAKVNAETVKANVKRELVGEKPLPLPLPAFEPYVMRHTALTLMSPLCDAFTLARIAGHSSITITQRYCHPQADAVEAAFSKFGNRKEVVNEGGHHENALPPANDGAGQINHTSA